MRLAVPNFTYEPWEHVLPSLRAQQNWRARTHCFIFRSWKPVCIWTSSRSVVNAPWYWSFIAAYQLSSHPFSCAGLVALLVLSFHVRLNTCFCRGHSSKSQVEDDDNHDRGHNRRKTTGNGIFLFFPPSFFTWFLVIFTSIFFVCLLFSDFNSIITAINGTFSPWRA